MPPRPGSGARRALAAGLALLVGLALPAALLLADIELVSRHLPLYRRSYLSAGLGETSGLDEAGYLLAVSRVLDYATGRSNELQLDRSELDGGPPGRPAFTPRELDHMVDVRELFDLARTWRRVGFAVAALAALAVGLIDLRRAGLRLARALLAGCAVVVLVLAVPALAALGDFAGFWDGFHEALFTNDLWLLPAGSLLIEMLPETLFRSLVFGVLALFAAQMLVLAVLAGIHLRRAAPAPAGERRKPRLSAESGAR